MLMSCTHCIFRAGSIIFGKTSFKIQKDGSRFSVPNVNNGCNKTIGNWNYFHEYVRHMRRNSSSYKISIWSSSSNASLAVLTCLTFFSVSCNKEYIQIAQYC